MSETVRKENAFVQSRNPILWGAYLACSWTWCICMFLPALLLRDMGWPGFVIFAIPNVLGAAAMGWILKSRADSIRFVEKHPTAIWWFSAITLAFHMFWMFWLASFIKTAFQLPNSYLYTALGIFFAFTLLSKKAIHLKRAPHLAAALLLFSLGVLLATFAIPDTGEASTALIAAAPQTLAPLWMLPVMIFGFVLCPYLDITFHHARQQLDTQKNGRLGFTLGFVGFFACMILLTTRYAGLVAGALAGDCFASIASPVLAAAILTHILCQWIFTVRVHFSRIQTLPGSAKKQPMLLALMLFSGAVGFLAIKLPSHAGLTSGEIIYRSFMSAYGLIFPAYLLYRIIAARRGIQSTLPKMWTVICLVFPLFWLGFIERQPIWLIPGIAIILLGSIVNFQKTPIQTD